MSLLFLSMISAVILRLKLTYIFRPKSGMLAIPVPKPEIHIPQLQGSQDRYPRTPAQKPPTPMAVQIPPQPTFMAQMPPTPQDKPEFSPTKFTPQPFFIQPPVIQTFTKQPTPPSTPTQLPASPMEQQEDDIVTGKRKSEGDFEENPDKSTDDTNDFSEPAPLFADPKRRRVLAFSEV